jgi:PAS domain S-box-containing protein
MKTGTRFGLISRIALLVVAIEVAAFSLLGSYYIDSFSAAAEEGIRSRLRLVGEMVARNDLAVSAVAVPGLMGDLVGAPFRRGIVIGGNGRVIVSSDSELLGQEASTIAGLDHQWPEQDRIIAGADSLTSVSRIMGGVSQTPVYVIVVTIGTAELKSLKRSVTWWGTFVSAAFILLTSAGIILVAQRLITRRVDTSLAVLKQVETGDLAARIPVGAEDELGQLQIGINSMTAKVGTLLAQHRRNEEEIATILDAIADGVIAIGRDGATLRVNPSAAAILGEDFATLGQRRVAELLPELALADGWCLTAESLTAHGRLHVERPGPGEAPRSIELGHGPIRDPDGSVVGAVLVLQDVTARKQAERELRDAVERLTVSNSELERFAYVASHDLQEPLRTITSFTQLLERRIGPTLEPDDREHFAFVVDAAKRMSMLIKDLLDYSRVNSRGIRFEPLSLRQACASALRNLHDTISASEAEVVVDELPMVMGDSSQLMQVFQNLIGNAIKYRRPDIRPRIHVFSQRVNGDWQVSVADNGIGIAATEQDIFEIFRRLHTAASYPGSGVGLAICKRIVLRHNGRIWYDSRPDEGTCFHFTLPVAGAAEAPAAAAENMV